MNPYLHTFTAIHSILRYFVIILTLVVAIQSVIGIQKKGQFVKGNRLAALFMLISCDLQLLAGLAVYYLGGHLLLIQKGQAMANRASRFFALEHPLAMVIGIVLVHFAYNTAKKTLPDGKKFSRIFWASFVALFLFVSQTPWPYKKDTGRPWLPGMTTATEQPVNA